MKTKETEELILQFKPLADKYAGAFCKKTPKGVYFEDLQSASYLGLIEAAHCFDAKLGDFSNFARRRIIGSIQDYLRSLYWGGKHKINAVSLDLEMEKGVCFFDHHSSCSFSHTIEDLNDLEQKIVTLYYVDGFKLHEIGSQLGVTKSRISQILKECHLTIKKRWASSMTPPTRGGICS
jgi:RNA polymerase sigma factor (sigma-70 family)